VYVIAAACTAQQRRVDIFRVSWLGQASFPTGDIVGPLEDQQSKALSGVGVSGRMVADPDFDNLRV
jgi:hypothetical protein